MLLRILLLLASALCFCVALLAATKASVAGHLFWYVRFIYFMALGITPILLWVLWKPGRNQATIDFSNKLYLFSFIGVFLSLPALQVVSDFIDPRLVSNRSYGTAIGSALYLLFGYVLWYYSVYRPHNKRFKSLDSLTRTD